MNDFKALYERSIKHRIIRVKDNILPFIIIGLSCGFLIGYGRYITDFQLTKLIFDFFSLEINLSEKVSSLLFEHVAIQTLTVLLVAISASSLFHKFFLGVDERDHNSQTGTTVSLDVFSSLLAIAWLGLMIGLIIPAWMTDSFSTALKFAFLCIYPVLYMLEISLISEFKNYSLFSQKPAFKEDNHRWKIKIIFECVFVVFIAVIVFIGQQKINEKFLELFQSTVNYIVNHQF